VNFDEETIFRRFHESLMDDDVEEQVAPIPEDHDPDHQDICLEPISEPKPPKDVTQKRPGWILDTLQDAEGHATPRGTFRERKRPHRYSGYSALMSRIGDSKLSIFDDVWDIVSRPKGKLVVTSKWIFKIKHVADGSIEKDKAKFVA